MRLLTRWVLARLSRESTDLSQSLNHIFLTSFDQINTQEKNLIDIIESIRNHQSGKNDEISLEMTDQGNIDQSHNEDTTKDSESATTTIGEMCRKSSLDPFWCFLLFKIIRELKPVSYLGLGTCMGISACYQATALKLNEAGKMTSMEGVSSLCEIARENFKKVGLDNIHIVSGRFQQTLDTKLTDIPPIDYAFIDGHHDEKAIWIYFEKIIQHLADRTILVFDDINWAPGMKRVWKRICKEPRTNMSFDLHRIGLCTIDRNLVIKKQYRLFNLNNK